MRDTKDTTTRARRHGSVPQYQSGCSCWFCRAAISHYQKLIRDGAVPYHRKQMQQEYERELTEMQTRLFRALKSVPIVEQFIDTLWDRLKKGLDIAAPQQLMDELVEFFYPLDARTLEAEKAQQWQRLVETYGLPPTEESK